MANSPQTPGSSVLSSSVSSVGSRSSRSSRSSKHSDSSSRISNFSYIQDPKKPNFAYKASDDEDDLEKKSRKKLRTFSPITILISVLQWIIIIYTGISFFYNYADGKVFSAILVMLIIELSSSLIMLYAIKNPGASCILLASQYIAMYYCFSNHLQSTNSYDSQRPIFERIMSLSVISLVSFAIHFFILIQSIRITGASEKRSDYSDKVIVEGWEKRKKELDKLICNLINEICGGDEDRYLNIQIADETTDLPVSIDRANVDMRIYRAFEMSMEKDIISLSTSNTSHAEISTPKSRKKKSRKLGLKNLEEVINSKYNSCQKQDNSMSIQ
eukprot:NP_493043.1 Uncharacterized protein CELE_F58D5.8 [Caenorhabditis elegans]